MNATKWMTVMLCVVTAGVFLVPSAAPAEEPKKGFIPDKALCEQMLRHGMEAYQRGKYLDAKAYFRKAVQADPSSPSAWKYYDLASVFALAERVEQDTGLITPGVSTRQEQAGGGVTPSAPAAPAPPAQPAPEPSKKKEGFKIVDDEGC
jgi:hypothetical protein